MSKSPSKFLRTLRFVLWWVVLAAALGFAALHFNKPAVQTQSPAQTLVQPGFPAAPFLLTTHEGKEFTTKDLEGKPFIVFFGFTHCPMICPTELADMSRWLDALQDDAKKLNALFVSVDPERDTVLALNSYMKAFPALTGLTGTPEQIEKLSKDYYFYYKKVPMDNGGYNMDHPAGTYLFDKAHTFVGTIDADEKDDMAIQKLRLLLTRD